MPYSEQSQGYVAYKIQSALGTQASGSDAEVLRLTGGQQGRLTKAAVESQEVRRDAMSVIGRHGTQKTAGAYDTELSIGNVDTILEAVMRGTYEAAIVVDDATVAMSSATLSVSSNVITASAGSFITSGFRVGDIVRESEGIAAADRDKNMRITALTATAMTVVRLDGTALTDAAGPIAAWTITRTGRKLINPAAGSLVKRYFTIEEYEVLIDSSEIFDDCVWSGMAFSMAPNGLFMANPSWTGTGQFETKTAGDAPFFSSPTETSAEPLAAIDAQLYLGSSEILDLTAFDLTIDTQATAPDVAASVYAPDVFQGAMTVGMNLTMLRSDLLDVADFINETALSLHVVISEPESAPEDFVSIYVPNFTLGSVDKSALSKAGGPRTHTIAVPPALVGKDLQGGAYDPAMIKFQVSNA